MWVGALFSRTFLAKSSASDLILDTLGVITQAVIALFFGIYFAAKLNFSPVQLLFYYLFVLACINPLQRRAPIREFEAMMLTGNVSNLLLKPYNFIVFICVRSFAQNILLLGIIGAAVIAFFMLAFPAQIIAAFSWYYVVRLLVAVVVTIVFLYLTLALFLYLTFFLEKINAYFRVYFMIGFFVAGGFFPAGLLPGHFAQYLPQFYLFGAPAQFVASGVILLPWLWTGYIALFAVLNVWLYRTCIRKLEVNGG